MTVATLRRALLDGTTLNDTQRQSVRGQLANKTNLAKLGNSFWQERRVTAYECCPDRQYWPCPDQPARHIGVSRSFYGRRRGEGNAIPKLALRSAPRSSTHIPSKTNRKVLAALEHAYRIGHRLDCFVTIHLEWTRFANRDRRAAVKAYREWARHWLTRRKVPFHDICVRENPPQIGSRPPNGEHFHQALSMPSERWETFEAELYKWLGSTDPKALLIKPIYNRNLVRWYFMKGGTDTVRQANAIPNSSSFPRHQGRIVGPRVIISYSLNHKAITDFLGTELARQVLASRPIAAKRPKLKMVASAQPFHEQQRCSNPIGTVSKQ